MLYNYTSAQAAKTLKKLSDEYAALLDKEQSSCMFNAAVGEDVDSVRPDYDYSVTQAKLDLLEQQIRTLKHALNLFNVTHVVPKFDMTIDEMLVFIPQLTKKKAKLAEMRSKLPKARVDAMFGKSSNIIDYKYVNYDIAQVDADYRQATDILAEAQLALDNVNSSETFSVEF